MDSHARGPFHHLSTDLEEPLAEAGKLGPDERHPARHPVAQGEHQPVGRGVQHQAELVGEQAVAVGAAGRRCISNRVFQSYEDILNHCCHTWNNLVSQPARIAYIGTRKCAHGF